MIGLEYLMYCGATLLFIYGFTAGWFLRMLWQRVRPRNLRDVLVKVAAALSWPYVVYQVFREAWE